MDEVFRETVAALRSRFESASKLIREVELEMAGLSQMARRERLREFDARVIALLKEIDDIAMAVRAFLRVGNYPKGRA